MAVEIPVKHPESLHPKTESLVFSPDASKAGALVAQAAIEGKMPNKGQVHDLVTSVGQDLAKEGMKINDSDIHAVEKRVRDALKKKKPVETTIEQSANDDTEPAINIAEYRGIMDNLFRTYNLGSGNWQAITGIYSGLDLVTNVIGGFQTRPWVNEEARRKLLDNVDRGLGLLKIRQTPVRELGKTLKDLDPKIKKEAAELLFSAGWPWIAGVANWFVSRRVEQSVDKMFGRERAKLQQAVNARVSESLFMREFEFLHDKSAGEIMDTINKGQFSTIHLISLTYKDFLPAISSIVSQLPRQYVTGKLEFLSSIIKIPFLISRSEKSAKFLKKNRAAELAAFDKVNTKLMTTLSGLESARTAGNSEAGAHSLLDTLRERDYLEAHGLGQKMASNRKMNVFFDVMDVGLPLIAEGLQMYKKGPRTNMSGEGAYNFGMDTLSRIVNSKNQQMEMRSAFAWLTQMYVDQIIPDIQDIKRMEELLGKYDNLDRPNGPKEMSRKAVSALKNTDIKIDNLSYKHILGDVSLDIPQGSFVTIKGESGTGKTTLMRTLVGLYTPDSGSVSIGGVPIDGVKKYGAEALTTIMGYANQNPQMLEGMTLQENLLLWSQAKVPKERIVQVMRDLRLDHLVDRLDSTGKHYSGGELRRIGIARALLKNPKILVLDEPTASLDAASAAQVVNIIQNLRKTRPDMTIVAITHDPVFEKHSEKIIDFSKINTPKVGAAKEQKTTLNDHQVLEAIARPRK